MKTFYSLYISALCLCYLRGNADGGALTSESQNLQKEIGQSVTILCEADLTANGILFMQVRGANAALVLANSLTDMDPKIVVKKYEPFITIDRGVISTKDGQDIRNVKINFTINSLNRTNGGEFKCEYGGQHATTNLTVLGPPYFIDIRSVSKKVVLKKIHQFDQEKYPYSSDLWSVKVDTDVRGRFTLEALPSSNPPANIIWKNDQSVVSRQRSIEIERDDPELNHTVYTVIASNDYGSYNISVVAIVQYAPRPPVITNKDIYPQEGKAAFAKCTFDAIPPAKVFYAKVNPITNSWDRLSDSNDVLHISDVQLDRDVGEYICKGENHFGSSSGRIFIHGKPKDVSVRVGNIYSTSADLLLKSYSAIAVRFNITINSTDEFLVKKTVTISVDERDGQNAPKIKVDYVLKKLNPDTQYTVTLTAYNRHGSAVSEPVQLKTKEEGVTRPPTTKAMTSEHVAEVGDDVEGAAYRAVGNLLILSFTLLIHLLNQLRS